MPYQVSSSFAPHLQEWGPRHAPCESLQQAEAYCRSLATSHYENFPVASITLPKRLRQPMCNVYAFCRWADDLGDEVEKPSESIELLNWWQEQVEGCFAGRTTHPVFVALAKTISEFELSETPFLDLISAFRQDQTCHSYPTMELLEDYCRRSANPVGRIVLRLFGEDKTRQIELSDSVCTGLQLINFWQDVSRDADIGRTYIPQTLREEFGYDDSMRTARIENEPFRNMMKSLVDDARNHLEAGRELCGMLSGRLRLAIEMFYRGGLAIAAKIQANGYRSWSERPTLCKFDVARIALAGTTSTVLGRR